MTFRNGAKALELQSSLEVAQGWRLYHESPPWPEYPVSLSQRQYLLHRSEVLMEVAGKHSVKCARGVRQRCGISDLYMPTDIEMLKMPICPLDAVAIQIHTVHLGPLQAHRHKAGAHSTANL